jgi:hypothetical protein
VDDRYPLGHCVVCTPWPALKRNPLRPGEAIQPPRKSVALVRADLFDQAAFDHRKKVDRMRTLAAKLTGKHASRMGEEELKAAREAVTWLQREEA